MEVWALMPSVSASPEVWSLFETKQDAVDIEASTRTPNQRPWILKRVRIEIIEDESIKRGEV